jgi:hypothetical protein
MKQFLSILLVTLIPLSSFSFGTDPKNPEEGSLTATGPMKIRKREARPDIPGTFLIELGFNSLQEEPVLMENTAFGSRTVNMIYFWDFEIGTTGIFFMPGIGLGLDRYKFDEDYTITQNMDGEVSFGDLTSLDLNKSMLVTNYVDIPLEFRYFFNRQDPKRSWNIGIGGKVGYLFASHTKIKYDEAGDDVIVKNKKEFGLNRFRYGVTGRVGYGGFNIFTYIGLSNLFDSGEGPANTDDVKTIQVGLSFTAF